MTLNIEDEIGGFSFFPLEFDKKARPVDGDQLTRLRNHCADEQVTDLLVVSHGWNNDDKEALRLYRSLLVNVGRQERGRFADRTVAVAGVFWPSKKFADSEVIPGGAASVGGDLSKDELTEDINRLRGFFDSDNADDLLDQLKDLVSQLEYDSKARRSFGEISQKLLGEAEPADPEVADEMPSGLLTMPGEELIDALSVPREEETVISGTREGGIAAMEFGGGEAGEPEGGAAFLGSLFSGVRSGARNALNLFTFYQMKNRAGVVGSIGLGPFLRGLESALPGMRTHLAGHSFGGRLVVASVNGDGSVPLLQASSMTLLQTAFSHNGFAQDYEPGKDGYFRRVVQSPGLPGPILATHTSQDLPNRWAYPMASRLVRQKAAFFGGPNDVYGAIGSNGAQKTPEARAEVLLGTDGVYRLNPGHVHNLESSRYISGHGAVTGPEVAHALVSAIVST